MRLGSGRRGFALGAGAVLRTGARFGLLVRIVLAGGVRSGVLVGSLKWIVVWSRLRSVLASCSLAGECSAVRAGR